MALTHAREGGKGSGQDRVSIPVTGHNGRGRAGQSPPRKRRSQKQSTPQEGSSPAQGAGGPGKAGTDTEMHDSSNSESSSGSDQESESGREGSAQEEQEAAAGDGTGVELQSQLIEGQPAARGIKRRRQHAQHALPMPAYPGVALERRALHHKRAQQYALRCALGLPVDIPYSAWGSLAHLKQQAKAVGITHIPEKVLLSYQPRDAPLRLIPDGTQVPQPGFNAVGAKQGAAGNGFGLNQSEDAMNGQQQVVWKTQASCIPTPADTEVMARARYTGPRDMRRLVLGEGQPSSKFSFKPASAHYEGLVKDTWMDVSSARQFGLEYVSLLGQQPGPSDQWMTVSQCQKAVHEALYVVARGKQEQSSSSSSGSSSRNRLPALDAVAQQLEQQGVTHVPLMCLAAVMYKHPKSSLTSCGIRELAWRTWWPPACIQAVNMSPGAVSSHTAAAAAAAGEDRARSSGDHHQGIAHGHDTDGYANGDDAGGEEDSTEQRLAARHTASMKAAGLQVMSVAEACVYLQHLKAGTRPSWAQPSSIAKEALEPGQTDGGCKAATLGAGFGTASVRDTATHKLPAAVQSATVAPAAAAATATVMPGEHGRWVAALPSDIVMPVQHQPRAVSVEAASMLQHLHVPSSLLKGSPRSMCTLSDQCPTREDAVQVVEAAGDALRAHLGLQAQGQASTNSGQAVKGHSIGLLSGEQLSRQLAMLQACPTTQPPTKQQAGTVSGAAAPVHLGLNPLACSALPKLGCGACSTCTNAALLNQPCLRAALLLQTMCASSPKAGRVGRPVGSGPASQHDLDSGGMPDIANPGSSTEGHSLARQRLSHVDTKQALQREYRQQLEAQVLQSGQPLVLTPSECVADPSLWRATPTGGPRGLFRAPPDVSRVKDSLLRIQDEELQHANNAMQVAAAAACPMVALQEPVLSRCDWCMAVDHTKPACPLWQLMAYPTLAGASSRGHTSPQQQLGREGEQPESIMSAGDGEGNASTYPNTVAALAVHARRTRRTTSHRQKSQRKGYAGGSSDTSEQQQNQESVDHAAGSSHPDMAAGASKQAAGRNSCAASGTQTTRSPNNEAWLHVEGSLVLQSGPRGQPTQVQARALPPSPGSDAPLTVQVRTKQERPWHELQVLQEHQLGVLALEQHLTLQHQHSAAPTWLPYAPSSVVDGVVAMRNTLAWLGHGSANSAATQLHAAPSLVQNSKGAHAQQPAAQSARDDSGNANYSHVAEDVWQSPEVCLALVLLAQEQAADLAWPRAH